MLNTIIDCDDKTLEKRLQDELNAVPNCLDSPDSSAGMAAFLKKRKPLFNQYLHRSLILSLRLSAHNTPALSP